MANRINEVLNAQGMSLVLFTGGVTGGITGGPTGGMSKAGIGITGTWVGTLSFFGSTDGINFNIPLSMTTFASGAVVQTTSINGNFEVQAQNFVAVKVVFSTYTSGAAVVKMAASIDSSYQEAFLTATSLFVNQEQTGGTLLTMTIGSQANRAWRLRTLSGGFSTAPAAAVKVTISDGPSSVLWTEYVAASAGQFKLNLPVDPDTPGQAGGGVVGTPGNSMVITVGAPGGSITTELNAEMIPA